MTSSSTQKTQNIKKLRIGRKCTKYNFVAPLIFTDCSCLGLDQKFRSSSNLGLEQKLSRWNFIESSSLRFDWHFPCQVLATAPTRDSNKNVLSETSLKFHCRALPNNLQAKLCWKWNFIDSVWGFNQTLCRLSSCSLCMLVLDILKSLFSSNTGKNHNSISLLAWKCFMKIIVCVFVTSYQCIMETCPE